MFYLIRFILFLLVSGILIFVFRKKFFKLSFRDKCIHILFAVHLFLFSCKIPFDIFIPFQNAEDAFKYVYYNENVAEKLETETFDFIFYGDKFSTWDFSYVNKNNGRWFYRSPFAPIRFEGEHHDNYWIECYTIREHKTKLVLIEMQKWEEASKDLFVQDNLHSEFIFFDTDEGKYYYTFVDSTITNYQLTIGEDVIDFQD